MSDTVVKPYGTVGRYFVLYLDVQGVRDQIFKGIDYHSGCVDAKHQEQIDELTSALQGFFTAFAQIVYFIKERPAEYSAYLTKDIQLDQVHKLQPGLDSEIRDIAVGVQQFSDSTLIYVRDTGNVSQIVFEQCMSRCAYEMVKVMGRGVYVRGAISYGTGWELMPNCLFGPIIQEVYELEQQVANTFRIVITPAFYRIATEELRSLVAHGSDMTQAYPFKMIGRDPDGVLSFDYLSDVAIENFKRYDAHALTIVGENLVRAYNRIAVRHRELLQEVDADQRQSRLVGKYEMFMSYLESRFKNFEALGARFVKDDHHDEGGEK